MIKGVDKRQNTQSRQTPNASPYRLSTGSFQLLPTFGFTIIELLVVIGIMSILVGFAIPAYNTFNQSNQLKQSGETVIQGLRDLQNRAATGNKSASCPAIPAPSPGFATTYTFDGWYMQLTQNTSSYAIAGYCGIEQSYSSGTIAQKTAIPLNDTSVKVSSVTFSPSNTVTSPVYIVFKPVSQSVDFYNSTFPTGTPLPDTQATIQLTQGTKTYSIVVQKSGAIYAQ